MNTLRRALKIYLALAAAAAFIASSAMAYIDLNNRVSAIEETMSVFDGTIVNMVEATCTKRNVAGGSLEVPFAHPLVIISQKGFPFGYWVEIVVEEGAKNTYLIAFSIGDQPSIVRDGWLTDIKGLSPEHIFSSNADYTLRIWRHPYEDGMPSDFKKEELVFERDFIVPRCQ